MKFVAQTSFAHTYSHTHTQTQLAHSLALGTNNAHLSAPLADVKGAISGLALGRTTKASQKIRFLLRK